MTPITAFAILFVAVIFTAMFAGYETGFVSVNPIRLRFLAEEEHQKRAARLLRYHSHPDQMLTMLLIGTNIGTVAATLAISRSPLGELGAMLIVTPLLLLFGEIVPKSVFRMHPNRLSLALLPAVELAYVLLSPLAAPVSWLTRALFRTAGAREQHISPLMATRDDVRVLVDESADHGTIEPEERRMIHSVINLQATQAKEIMVPRIDIQALPDTATRQELVDLLVESGRTRIPIYRESIDEVIGVVSAHEVLLDTTPDNPDITRFIHEVKHVPDSMKVDDLLQELRKTKQHLAIVTDEYGGTDGLVTIEDILEEIFGDIMDEHDREESQIHQVGQNAYVIDARTYLEDASEAVGVAIEDDEVETVGGWVMHVAGRIPLQGEVITHGRFRITVLDAGGNCIAKIRLELLPEPGTGASANK
ncbi:MAG: hemolysin family protein [Candidatus Hydrogenedentes bacterium]|nr:hemolysin family protein [Candidatus Hydrogenedentota bacterium]